MLALYRSRFSKGANMKSLVLLLTLFTTLTYASNSPVQTEQVMQMDNDLKSISHDLENDSKGRVYIVNEDGTITFLKSAKKLYIVNEDGTITFLTK